MGALLRIGGAMLTPRPWWPVLFVLSVACLAPPALAQNVILNAPGVLPKSKAPAPPPPPARPAAWPRLDPGAVLCNTDDDLDRHASNMTSRVGGGGTRATDCRIISQPTGIQILSRQGPGRTQVKLPGDVTGWTDVWLPEKAPPGR
jgi:hypothetical protein